MKEVSQGEESVQQRQRSKTEQGTGGELAASQAAKGTKRLKIQAGAQSWTLYSMSRSVDFTP